MLAHAWCLCVVGSLWRSEKSNPDPQNPRASVLNHQTLSRALTNSILIFTNFVFFFFLSGPHLLRILQLCLACWYMPVIPVLEMLRQEDFMLDHIARSLKKEKRFCSIFQILIVLGRTKCRVDGKGNAV